MAYEKQTWTDGSTPVDASHMSHIEDGIAALDNDKAAKSDLDALSTKVDEEMKTRAEKDDEQDEKIQSNTDLIDSLGLGKVEINGFSANTTYRFQFGGVTSSAPSIGILYVRGNTGVQHLTLFVSGYGYSSARVQINELTKGSAVSYEIGEDEWYIDVTPTAASGGNLNVIGYLCIYGVVPTITAI